MTPFIKLTSSQVAAILSDDPQVWSELKIEDITPELRRFIEQQKGK